LHEQARWLLSLRTAFDEAWKEIQTEDDFPHIALPPDSRGRVITYGINAVGEPTSAQDTANGIKYATSATYTPFGAQNG